MKGKNTDYNTIIIRLSGEIGVKSEWTRLIYEKKLIKNLKYSLKELNIKTFKIIRARGRIYLKIDFTEEIEKIISRIFGISSFSPAKQIAAELNSINETAITFAKELFFSNCSFAVRCHRVGTHKFSSLDVCIEVGENILNKSNNRGISVNLTNPDITINIEVRDESAFIYTKTTHGPGGFPLGTQGKTVCLLSGGIDSPVACWLTMRRGSPTIPIYIDNYPYADKIAKEKAIQSAKKIKEWSSGHIKKMYIVPNGINIKKILDCAPKKFTCLLCKRLMYRIGSQIAKIENSYGVVTGEAIGEQASQTMHNLYVLNEATNFPIHRPLLSFDKLETEKLAKKIGTYDISVRKDSGCKATPSQPATRASLQAVKDIEEKLDVKTMIEKTIQLIECIIV